MGHALVISADQSGGTATTGEFIYLTSGGIAQQATEPPLQFPIRVAGTFSKFGVNVNATGTGRVFKFRKNAADGNQSVSPTDSTAGLYDDTSNTDAVTSGDLVDVSVTETGTDPTVFAVRSVFDATSDTACFYCANYATVIFGAANTNFYLGLLNHRTTTAQSAADGATQGKIRTGGTLKNFCFYTAANARPTNSIATVNINGTNATCTVTISASTTGLFEDTTHSDTVSPDDLVCVQVACGAGSGGINTTNGGFAGCAIVNSSSAVMDQFGGADNASGLSAGTTRFNAIGGRSAWNAAESQAKIAPQFDLTLSNIRVNVTANTYTGAATVISRINGANGNQTITISAGTTGWMEDSTHTDSVTASQTMNLQISGGTANSATIKGLGSTITPAGAAAAAISRSRIFSGFDHARVY